MFSSFSFDGDDGLSIYGLYASSMSSDFSVSLYAGGERDDDAADGGMCPTTVFAFIGQRKVTVACLILCLGHGRGVVTTLLDPGKGTVRAPDGPRPVAGPGGCPTKERVVG